MLYPSKYNHLVQLDVKGQPHFILNNLFIGACDFINEKIYKILLEGEKRGYIPKDKLPDNILEHLLKSGFLWETPYAEEMLIQSGINSYGDRSHIAAGLNGGYYGFITSLYCNLACPYCFQRDKADSIGFLSPSQVDLGIKIIKDSEEKISLINNNQTTIPKISITGGEPLLRNRNNLKVLNYLIEKLYNLNWPYSITTNGTELSYFVQNHDPTKNCRNIQVTIDGPKHIHNKRRYYRDGSGSFDKIVNGTNQALEDGWKITLRVNLDMQNIKHLPKLAEFISDQNWLSYDNFFPYVSPITDHQSLGDYEIFLNEADLLKTLLMLTEISPIINDVFDIRHFRGFNYVERILLKKDPRYPVIFRCEAVMGMYIFDPKGDIYVCLESVGDKTLRIGTYEPELIINKKAESKWSQRNVLNIRECDDCKIRFLCAGGCTMEAINRNKIQGCMPFLEEMNLAWQYYAKNMPELFE